MLKDTTLTIHLNKEIKEQASEVVAGMGIDLSTAVNMFLVELTKTNELPFVPTGKQDFPDIWNDDPKDIAAFNKKIGIRDDGVSYGRENAD
ncbi:type II toxin-antitoxin system RelB/DinJ family antitoxin [Lactiplantibacillus sp. WILCCON 0030]|uniref:Type II toxin-antitoxin system RelB/DinJ family antitoxin n=1 Tax=Lactiplantibacillus brownii TaxID=3069269 RepID=A0ABU1ABJ8_9LACO|nr:type II toxin-antitoxin system RelB/DinJ family antitoxin [Lactiplantibacillus brownii]MDQ7938322.1 type II toxin-antitoxin system RelB/DinJ family antitoxin [Lactiplantibacillus brownii]